MSDMIRYYHWIMLGKLAAWISIIIGLFVWILPVGVALSLPEGVSSNFFKYEGLEYMGYPLMGFIAIVFPVLYLFLSSQVKSKEAIAILDRLYLQIMVMLGILMTLYGLLMVLYSTLYVMEAGFEIWILNKIFA